MARQDMTKDQAFKRGYLVLKEKTYKRFSKYLKTMMVEGRAMFFYAALPITETTARNNAWVKNGKRYPIKL